MVWHVAATYPFIFIKLSIVNLATKYILKGLGHSGLWVEKIHKPKFDLIGLNSKH